MPIYQVDLERHVSRTVSLRQTTKVLIDAPDLKVAQDAAWAISGDEDVLDENATGGWVDDDSSRQAGSDEVDRRPRPERTYKVKFAIADYIPPVMVNAIEILDLDPNDFKDG
jgi:hypothetical protein